MNPKFETAVERSLILATDSLFQHFVSLQVMEKFLERKYVFCTREFRQFAEENARQNVQGEVVILRGRAEHLRTCKEKGHTCGIKDGEIDGGTEVEECTDLCSQD